MPILSFRAALAAAALVAGCGGAPWNSPHPAGEAGGNVLYASFKERPKHLDPVQSYSENEYSLIANIYQPPLQYHYFKRPYELVPFAALEMPRPEFFDAKGRRLPDNADAKNVAYSDYVIRIRPGILYQPHPAFAKDGDRYVYHDLKRGDLDGIQAIGDFKRTGTRELVAADYVHQLKRLAHPRLHSPIMQLMGDYIVGLKELAKELAAAEKAAAKAAGKEGFLDLTKFDLAGAQVVDRHTYRVRVHGKYPQFVYWLAMPFFAPVPPESDRFYAQPGMTERNISLDWFPVGSGPYMLTVNNPNRQMVLERNPNYRGETYPAEGEPGDAEQGLLKDAGKPLPFIDKVVFALEKEQIPYWNKFLQGYYDASGISSDTFDQAVQFSGQGDVTLSDDMKARGIQLQTSVATSVFYLGFNMLDRDVGGTSERARKVRRAISIAIDQEEYISIFLNGRGIAAQGPIAPGIFGYKEGKEGINPYVYDWVDGAPRRKSIDEARKLLAEAGYPNGRDAKTGQPLLLNLDTARSGPEAKATLDWYIRQLEKIGVQLAIRSTDWNRFQDKVRKGNTQLYFLGWNADYPDPENFLFLLHGPQAKVKTSGENASNFENAEFDRLFDRMKSMPNGPERQAVIDRMVEILRHDAPWVWSFFPKDYGLRHAWVHNRKPHSIANNGLKYQRINPELRVRMQREWNKPVVWPAFLVLGALAVSVVPAVRTYRRRERETASR
jgi:oligopeptide transport system substrate-binding protein